MRGNVELEKEVIDDEILLRTEELQDLRLKKKTRRLTVRGGGEENLERLSRKSREQGIGFE